MSSLERIAIVTRGEAAMRIINAVREYNAEHGTDLRTIALFTDPDRRAMFVRRADEAHHIGPATVPTDDGARRVAYDDPDLVAAALEATGADGAWFGWGLDADLVDRCESSGVRVIGPPGDVVRRVGDPAELARIAEVAGVRSTTRPDSDAEHRAHLIQVQVVGDTEGTVWSLGVRESSVQLGQARVLTEAPHRRSRPTRTRSSERRRYGSPRSPRTSGSARSSSSLIRPPVGSRSSASWPVCRPSIPSRS